MSKVDIEKDIKRVVFEYNCTRCGITSYIGASYPRMLLEHKRMPWGLLGKNDDDVYIHCPMCDACFDDASDEDGASHYHEITNLGDANV